MGGVIYSGALRGGFLDCSRRSGRCASILGFADCGARGGNSHAYASASYKEGGDVERKAGYHSARGYGVPVLRGAIVDAGFAMVVPALRSGEERGGAKLETRKQRRENRQKHRSEDRPPQWRARALIGSQWLFLKTQLGHSPYISQCGANSYSHPNASEQDERPKRSFRKRVICRMS